MYKHPQSVAHRDMTSTLTDQVSPGESERRATMAVLTDASSGLMGLGRRIEATPRWEYSDLPPRAAAFLPGRLEPMELTSVMGQTRRSAKGDTLSFYRFSSEVYPDAAPTNVHFISGNATRLIGRDQVLLLP